MDISLETMNVVFVGHVDHGKSTVVGRMLADTGSLPEGKLEAVKAMCEKNSRPFEYAFLLDALKDEQAQGITIDTARSFFKSTKRHYIIIDAPGHIEFLKNMVSGAARAEAAVLIIDAQEGIKENSKRHGYLLSMLGIKQIVVCINKMDLVSYSQEVFNEIKVNYSKFLKSVDIIPQSFIPASGMKGDNVASGSDNMKWFSGNNVLTALDAFKKEDALTNKPFRMYVQDIYKFTMDGDDRRICAGRIESGNLTIGDELMFLPSKKKTRIKTLENFNSSALNSVVAGKSTGFTMTEQIYIKRGEFICKTSELMPQVGSLIRVNIFWMGKAPMVTGKDYFLKIGTDKVNVKLVNINKLIDATENKINKAKSLIERHDVADCDLRLQRNISFDLNKDFEHTSRFVIVDNFEIAGGGIIQDVLTDDTDKIQKDALQRDIKFERSFISQMQRSEKFKQTPILVIITGPEKAGKKPLAKAVEEKLFNKGNFVYFLGIRTVKYGVDTDLINLDDAREEHLRRFGEITNLMLDAGLIVVATARDLDQYELNSLEAVVAPNNMITVAIDHPDVEKDNLVNLGKEFVMDEAVIMVESMLASI